MDEERQLAPHNLSDAFDMVGDQQVYKRQVLTWLLLWQTWTDSLILLSARVSDPVYVHT